MDRTYFVAESAGVIRGCGGWSRRRTLFGGDQYEARDPGFSGPAVDASKIRAFFVHPQSARRGMGRALATRCEGEAKAAGYRSVGLMSALPGVPFYLSLGYTAGEPVTFKVAHEVDIQFVAMKKISEQDRRRATCRGLR
jgi:GNAT superfamily N-acetyltransferase